MWPLCSSLQVNFLSEYPSSVWRNLLKVKPSGAFLALKCFEILRRLKAMQSLEDMSSVMPELVITELNTAEIECAGFIDIAFDLIDSWDL